MNCCLLDWRVANARVAIAMIGLGNSYFNQCSKAVCTSMGYLVAKSCVCMGYLVAKSCASMGYLEAKSCVRGVAHTKLVSRFHGTLEGVSGTPHNTR